MRLPSVTGTTSAPSCDDQISHECHLVEGADHVGPSIVARTREAFSWLGAQLADAESDADAPLSDTSRAWIDWLERGFTGDVPPPLDMASSEAIRVLRLQCAPGRAEALGIDPTTNLRFGKLPGLI